MWMSNSYSPVGSVCDLMNLQIDRSREPHIAQQARRMSSHKYGAQLSLSSSILLLRWAFVLSPHFFNSRSLQQQLGGYTLRVRSTSLWQHPQAYLCTQVSVANLSWLRPEYFIKRKQINIVNCSVAPSLVSLQVFVLQRLSLPSRCVNHYSPTFK